MKYIDTHIKAMTAQEPRWKIRTQTWKQRKRALLTHLEIELAFLKRRETWVWVYVS
jgi:hypothetical protein